MFAVVHRTDAGDARIHGAQAGDFGIFVLCGGRSGAGHGPKEKKELFQGCMSVVSKS